VANALGLLSLAGCVKIGSNVSPVVVWAMWPGTVKQNRKKLHRVDSFPKTSINPMSTTMRKIWLAKDSHAGGASGSKASILDVLNDAPKEEGDDLVSTELGLGQQNPSSPLAILSSPLLSPFAE
jgi:hypothetical protein